MDIMAVSWVGLGSPTVPIYSQSY